MAKKIDIRLIDTLGAPAPIRGGVPFPRGVLTPAAGIRLTDTYDANVPFDAEPICMWPDGSIRWLRLDFVAPPERQRLCLHYGVRQTEPPPHTLAIAEDEHAFHIDTGPLAFDVSKQSFGVLRNCTLVTGRRRAQVLDNAGLELITRDYFRRGYTASNENAQYSCVIEEQGAHHAVFRITGSHVSKRGTLFDYDMRLHCWAGSQCVRLTHVLRSRQDEELPQARAVEIRAPLSDSPLVFSTGMESSYTIEDDIGDGALLLQTGPTRMRPDVRFQYAQDGRMVGRIGEGWASVSGEVVSVTTAVRRFRQQHPKGFRLNRDELSVLLWPEEAEEPMVLPRSCEKTHEVMLVFHGVRDPELAEAALLAKSFTKPGGMACLPSWYCASRAMGELIPAGSKGFEDYGRAAAGAFAALKKRRYDLREYGDFDYGDFSDDDMPGGWINVEYDTPHCLLTQFARTAKRDYLDWGIAAATHQGDIDIAHFVPTDPGLVGSQSIHATGHLGRESKWFYYRTDHIWTEGLVKAYWLTGDRRHLENAILAADFLARTDPCPDDGGSERAYAWPLIALSAVYEATLDAGYIAAARRIAGMVLEKAHPVRGLWLREWGHDESGNPILGSSPFMSGLLLEGLVSYNAIALDPRVDDFVVKAARALIDEAWIEQDGGFYYHPGIGKRERGRPTDTRQLLGLVRAYEVTGEKRYIEVAVRSFNAAVAAHLASLSGQSVRGAADKSAKNLAIFLRSTPRFVAALRRLRI